MVVPTERRQVLRTWGTRVNRWSKLLQRRPRGYREFLLAMLSERCGLGRSLGRPVSITLEPTNVCNLQCPVCETGAGVLERKPGMMSYEGFVKIMDKVGPGANHLMFYFMGEPFLNREAYRMIRYARDMGIRVTSCTNGEPVDPQALYDSGINHISFQIGGMTQRSHEVYRKKSDLYRIFENLTSYLQILQTKGKRPSEHEVELGLIVMRHNEGEISAFLERCKTLGVQSTLISPCVRTPEQARTFLPEAEAYWLYDRGIWERGDGLAIKRHLPWNRCPWFYFAVTIQVNGDVVPCCRDAQGKNVFGNLFSESLESVWNGPRFRKWRRAFSRRPSPLDLCRLCPGEGAPMLS